MTVHDLEHLPERQRRRLLRMKRAEGRAADRLPS
jgi:hypothetical protein